MSYNRQDIEQPVHAFEMCVDIMTTCLSLTTKDAVEQISQDLHQLILTFSER
jgi:hypothetical protein